MNPPSQFWDTTSHENCAVASSKRRASSRLRGDEAAPAAQAQAGSSGASPHPNSRYFQGSLGVGTTSTSSAKHVSKAASSDVVERVPTLLVLGFKALIFLTGILSLALSSLGREERENSERYP